MAELDREKIAAAALAVADERGIDGFTMRAVADMLGVTPMALYHHVADKAALATLLVEAAINAQPLPASTGDWREDLWRIAKWMRASTQAHPVVAHNRRAYAVWTESSLQITERWLGLWQQSGLPLENAVTAATTSSLAIVGIVAEEAILAGLRRPSDAQLSWLPNARVVFSARPDREANFELTVRALIDGLHARLGLLEPVT
ncbi:MAG TPA: TetR family transcriptional regulator [Chloroflexota bacterium]